MDCLDGEAPRLRPNHGLPLQERKPWHRPRPSGWPVRGGRFPTAATLVIWTPALPPLWSDPGRVAEPEWGPWPFCNARLTPPGRTLSIMGSSQGHRLQLPYLSPGYSDRGVGAFRIDPPPKGMHPVYSEEKALEAFWRSAPGRMCAQRGATATARFGLYSGKRLDVSPDGRLTGPALSFTAPGWLILVEGLILRPSGPGRDSRSTPESLRSAPENRRSVCGHAIHVVGNGTGEPPVGIAVSRSPRLLFGMNCPGSNPAATRKHIGGNHDGR